MQSKALRTPCDSPASAVRIRPADIAPQNEYESERLSLSTWEVLLKRGSGCPQFSDNRYFTTAPFQTDKQGILLEELEMALSWGQQHGIRSVPRICACHFSLLRALFLRLLTGAPLWARAPERSREGLFLNLPSPSNSHNLKTPPLPKSQRGSIGRACSSRKTGIANCSSWHGTPLDVRGSRSYSAGGGPWSCVV
jgi:hypothetical protein